MSEENLIYLKDNRVIFAPSKKEYDVTDHLDELIKELNKLKTR